MFTARCKSSLITFLPSVKFLPHYCCYQLDRDRPQDRAESLRSVLGMDNPAIAAIPWLGASLFKGGYSGLGQVAEINRNEAGREGLQVAGSHRKARSGRYS